jgi:integrase
MPKSRLLEKKSKAKKRYIPTMAESLKIISFISPSERDIYLFLITHGCRPNEARAIQAGDFNFTDATVTIQRGFSGDELHEYTKTGHEYTIPIHEALFEKLKLICLHRMPSDFVFSHKGRAWSETRTYLTWRNAAVKAGLPHISNYAGVKHASASEITDKTGDIFNTSKLIGHRGGIQNTLKYTERRDIKTLRKLQSKIVIPNELISP